MNIKIPKALTNPKVLEAAGLIIMGLTHALSYLNGVATENQIREMIRDEINLQQKGAKNQ